MSQEHSLKNPGPLVVSSGLKTTLMLFALVGLGAFVGGLFLDSKRTWFSFIHNHFYFMSLSLGGLFFAALQWLTGAMWSATVRRVSEAFAAYLPISLLSFLVLYFGIHDLYLWSIPSHVHGDLVLEGKSGYLSAGFFVLRNVLAISLWIFFAKKFVGNSLAQDATGDLNLSKKNQFLAPVFMILFALSYTMVSFDELMSLDPHWFSTIFGVYCFAGLFYSNLALTCVVSIWLKRKGCLAGIVNENHFHDLGKFMFAFTVFWAYIGFSQFMLIWYANMPEETGYFLHRFNGGWLYVSLFLLIGKFMGPFFLLLPRDAKRNETHLFRVGIFMLVAQWMDIYWLVQPEFSPSGPLFGWIEFGVTLGFLGVFGSVVLRFLSRHNVVAIGDPRLLEAVYHHHQ